MTFSRLECVRVIAVTSRPRWLCLLHPLFHVCSLEAENSEPKREGGATRCKILEAWIPESPHGRPLLAGNTHLRLL